MNLIARCEFENYDFADEYLNPNTTTTNLELSY